MIVLRIDEDECVGIHPIDLRDVPGDVRRLVRIVLGVEGVMGDGRPDGCE
jgi:hypothetical protein